MNFNFKKTLIDNLIIVETTKFSDDRGYFLENYKKPLFAENGIKDDFVQDNRSYSKKNVVRGLHFQAGESQQAKLVQCLSGEIYDVAVDLRKNSPTFGKHFGIILTPENGLMLYIPEGFAHGFSVLSDDAVLHYKVSSLYNPKSEFGLRWDDPTLAIDWKVENPIVSTKDQELPLFKDLKVFA